MPYLVHVYNEEYGDIEEVVPVDRFDDGVAYALASIENKDGLSVDVKSGCFHSLEVRRGNITVVSVNDVEYATAVQDYDNGAQIMAACNALASGDQGALVALFSDQVL